MILRVINLSSLSTNIIQVLPKVFPLVFDILVNIYGNEVKQNLVMDKVENETSFVTCTTISYRQYT